MITLETLLFTLTWLNLGLILWQWFVAWRFPLHQRRPTLQTAPSVTLLKPLKGCDAETAACLRSWLVQDYVGPVQILFGVADEDDPVCPVVRELISAHSHCDARLVVCGESRWQNAKASILVQLQKLTQHDLIVVSDADVRAPSDLLGQLAAALADPQIGLVNCLYRHANPSSLAMRWEAFVVNADFWSQVLQARDLKPLDFALGAVMALTRQRLEALGGFEQVADYLADDCELGNRIAQQGARVELVPVVVDCFEPRSTWQEVWAHQVRWARTIRACRPFGYAVSQASNGTLWPLLCLLAQPRASGIAAASLCLGLRAGTALYTEKKMTGKFAPVSLLIVPVKDLLQTIIWGLAFTSSVVIWRGEKFRALAGGKLVKDVVEERCCRSGSGQNR
jgi:ceramide glucosyltransferase